MKRSLLLHLLGLTLLNMLWFPYAHTQAPRELRVYCSQNSYLPGETIAFQVFNPSPSAGANHSLYAELVNCRGQVFDQKVLPLRFNSVNGHFIMPDIKNDDGLLLHCYTMRGEKIEASHISKIFMPGKENTGEIPSKKISLQYYFEGGTWVAESPNNILVRCTDENGFPVVVTGKVIDSLRRIYGGFQTDSDGYGKVRINPEAGVRYFLTAAGTPGQYAGAALPEPDTTGVTMGIEITDSSVDYTVVSYNRQEPEPHYKLSAYLNTDTIYTSDVIFPQGLSMVTESILRNQLTEGYITFLLTDKWQKICARRTIYHASAVSSPFQFMVEDTISHKRALVELPGFNGKTGALNLMACDENSASAILQQSGSNNVSQQLPALIPGAENNIPYNDRLIAVTTPPSGYDLADDTVNRYLNISGKVYDNEKRPLKNKKLNFFIVQKNLKKIFYTASSDKYGNFSIPNVRFADTARLYYQLADKSDEKNDIQADLSISPSLNGTAGSMTLVQPYCLATAGNPEAVDSTVITKAFVYIKDSKTMEEVLVNGKAKKTDSEKFAEDYISGAHNQKNFARDEFDFIKNPEVVDNKYLFDFLRGRMGSLIIRLNAKGELSITTRHGSTVGIYLNDMEVDALDLNTIAYLMVSEIALVRYYSMPLKPRMMDSMQIAKTGSNDPGGDLMIYTKRDFTPAEPAIRGLPKKTIKGYSPALNFSTATATRLPSSIYWRSAKLPAKDEVIRIGLPAGAACILFIHAVNELMAPVEVAKKLSFD
ncbi:MAG: hypothetical protein U0V75_11215 [Ferruginibacter sp.]